MDRSSLDGRAEDLTVLRLTGEIDLANADDVRDRIMRAGSPGPLVLDLDGLGYIDSAGIRVLDEVADTFATNRWPLRIVAAPQAVCRRVLEIGAPGLPLHASADRPD